MQLSDHSWILHYGVAALAWSFASDDVSTMRGHGVYEGGVAGLQTTKIFVNGVWVGVHRDPSMLVRTLRQMRRQVDISTEVRTCSPAVLGSVQSASGHTHQ